MRVYIIEDEPHAQRALQQLLERVAPEVKVAGVASTAAEGIALIKAAAPDFIFLDVRLGEATGFDVLRQFPDPSFSIVFVTAYDEYAVQAFKWNAIHYLTKPLESAALRQAIDKVKQQQFRWNALQLQGVIQQVTSKEPSQHIVLAYNSIVERLPLKRIIRLESDSGITHFYYMEEDMISQKRQVSRKTVSLNIGHYASLLPGQFFRCHQSHIVNRAFVQLYDKSQQIIRLHTGDHIPVSRRGKEGINEWIKQQEV